MLGNSLDSPATLAILGGATGLIIAISHNFWTLKGFTLANIALWSAYSVTVGAYTNLIGNAFVLVGVLIAVWRHMRNNKTESQKPISTPRGIIETETNSYLP